MDKIDRLKRFLKYNDPVKVKNTTDLFYKNTGYTVELKDGILILGGGQIHIIVNEFNKFIGFLLG